MIYDSSQPSNKEWSLTSYPMPFSTIRYGDHRREKNSSLNHFSMRKSISSHLILKIKTDVDIYLCNRDTITEFNCQKKKNQFFELWEMRWNTKISQTISFRTELLLLLLFHLNKETQIVHLIALTSGGSRNFWRGVRIRYKLNIFAENC